MGSKASALVDALETVAEPEIKPVKVEYTNRYADSLNDKTALKIDCKSAKSDTMYRPRSARAAALKMRLGED
jgi:hypothetical protein